MRRRLREVLVPVQRLLRLVVARDLDANQSEADWC